MARIEPLVRSEHPELADLYEIYDGMIGFVSNGVLTLARQPEVARTFAKLGVALHAGRVPKVIKSLVAYTSCAVVGCKYCQAHGAAGLEAISPEAAAKAAAVPQYETSELFTEAERAAIRLAHHAQLVPNQATDEDFAALREHFDDDEIVEILATIAVFGWLTRWNETIGTEVEPASLEAAERVLGPIADWPSGPDAF